MKKYLLLVAVLLYSIGGYSQQMSERMVADSLIKELSSGRYDKKDTSRFDMLEELSFRLVDIDPDEGIKYALEARELAIAIPLKKGLARTYYLLGIAYRSKSDFAKAMDNGMKALSIFEHLNATENILATRSLIGGVYFELGNYRKALEYDSVSFEMNRKLGRKSVMAKNLNNMGGSYDRLNNFVRALECYTQALQISEELQDDGAIASSLASLASYYGKQKNYALEMSYNFKALRIQESLDDKYEVQVVLGNIGNSYFDIARQVPRTTPADSLIAEHKEENLKRSINYLTRSIAIARERGDMAAISDVSDLLSQALYLAGDYKGACEAMVVYAAYRDSVYSADNRLKIAEIETNHEKELKEKQIELNVIETKNKRNERILYAVILVVGAAGVYKNYRTQRKTNRMQAQALAHKEMLMKEIHHRVKNNLQVISTLLDLQLVNISDEQAKGAITESTTRLKTISLMHQQLYQDDHITTIELSRFAGDLHTQLNGIFGRPGQRIALQNDIPAGALDIDTAVPLGMILNELMTNSYKYAFNGGAGTITLKTENRGEDYRLAYSDSGAGMPADFDIRKSKSLGMRIIYRLSKQLGGNFEYDYRKKVFIITFKDETGRKKID